MGEVGSMVIVVGVEGSLVLGVVGSLVVRVVGSILCLSVEVVESSSSFKRFTHRFLSHFFISSKTTVRVFASAHAKNPITNQLKYNY